MGDGGSGAQPRSRADLLLVLPFILLFLVQLFHHEMWRDELNAWGIVVASPTPVSLYQHIRYEGHPSLWYIALWLPARFTASPLAMQVVQAFVGVAIYLTLALRSPFNRLEKVLLYTSYFISFEYTVMARMYGLTVLLLFIYLYRRSRYPGQVITNTALLALMANTDVTALFLSGALGAEYASASFRAWREGRMEVRTLRRAALVYAAGLLCTAMALRISPNISWRTTGRMMAQANDPIHLLQSALQYLATPWFPITAEFPRHFWNPWYGNPFEHKAMMLLALLVIAMCVWIFRRDWTLGVILILTAVPAIVFAHLVYMGSTRHYGVMFLAFVAGLWMMRYRGRAMMPVAVALLLLNSAAGALAAVAQWHHPFSQGRNAARWIRAHGLADAVLVGTKDTSVAGVAEQLERPIYFLDCNCRDTYLLFSNRRDDYNEDSIPGRLALASSRLNAPEMIFVASDPLPAEHVERLKELGFTAELMASFTGAEEWQENYFLYRVRRK